MYPISSFGNGFRPLSGTDPVQSLRNRPIYGRCRSSGRHAAQRDPDRRGPPRHMSRNCCHWSAQSHRFAAHAAGRFAKPKVIYADRGYGSDAHCYRLHERGIRPVIAQRRTEHGAGPGKFRWVVEWTHSWLYGFRRLCTRFECRSDIHEAFLKPACSLVCRDSFSRNE